MHDDLPNASRIDDGLHVNSRLRSHLRTGLDTIWPRGMNDGNPSIRNGTWFF